MKGLDLATSRDDSIDACLDRYGMMMRALLHVRASSGLAWNEANVTLPQIRVLSLLAGREAGMSGRELAAVLGVGPSAVSPLVDRLVDHGYVRREEDRVDRRITRLILTPAGLTVVQQMAAGRREVLAEVLQRLDSDELALVERAFELVHVGVQRAAAEDPARATTKPVVCAAPMKSKMKSKLQPTGA
ncbi:MAG: MarR family transcriptional regulator [Chloroflexota bacterium]